MDGLLLDTEIVYRAAMIEAGGVFGVQFTGETYASMVGKTNPECAVMLRELYGETFPAQAYFERVWADVEDLLEAETKLKAGVVEILDYLDDRGLRAASPLRTAFPPSSAIWDALICCIGSTRWWRITTSPATSPIRIPICSRPSASGSIRPIAWRWRTRTLASAPPTRPG